MNDEMLLQLLNEIEELQRRMDLERHKKPLVYDGSIEMELDRIREKIAELEGI